MFYLCNIKPSSYEKNGNYNLYDKWIVFVDWLFNEIDARRGTGKAEVC